MFCFKMRLPSAIVAHSYDRLRTTFLPTLDEALAHCANDAEMFFVCAHINVSLVARCLDCLCREILLPRRKYLEDSTGEHMIGRSPSNQIVIDHPTVSAHHAVLLRTGASYSLKDLNSMKGTQINGDFVTDAELKEGDTIRFGSVTAVFAEIYRKQRSTRAESGRSFLT